MARSTGRRTIRIKNVQEYDEVDSVDFIVFLVRLCHAGGDHREGFAVQRSTGKIRRSKMVRKPWGQAVSVERDILLETEVMGSRLSRDK